MFTGRTFRIKDVVSYKNQKIKPIKEEVKPKVKLKSKDIVEKALHQAIPIDQDSLTLLTRLYEVADYSESIPKSMDRDTAVNSLRTVLESIESLIETSGG